MEATGADSAIADGMHAIATFTLIPLGGEISLSGHLAACMDYLETTDLKVELHANATNLEGEWDTIMEAVKNCHRIVHARGVPRVHTNLQIGTRTDRIQTMSDKMNSILEKKSTQG